MTAISNPTVIQAARLRSERLNKECFCITLDHDALYRALEREAGDPDFCSRFIETRPHLFSNAPVFYQEPCRPVSGSRRRQIRQPIAWLSGNGLVLGAGDRVVIWVAWRIRGYDFHLLRGPS
jgi:hypothetical protein